MKIAIKKVGETLEIIETKEIYRTNAVRPYVMKDDFKSCEFVTLNSERTLFLGVNEDGLRIDLPTNFLIETTNPYFPIQKMVGDVVFVKTKPLEGYDPYDWEVIDLTSDDIKCISRLLDEDLQNELENKFEDYGKGYAILDRFF